ncbi:antigen-presenting glycoprotein CD1d isoform X2 [Pteropus medius]|uniref:antigen-presenting glycoprotein CD1d isoform X2 n=1 Tax=Pteropus vampyrus TaxID=132908 RepID=UPI00196B4610|nr:antigen-presenting glycoprotein CD1d isoform X2 [Pteropus giganteus]
MPRTNAVRSCCKHRAFGVPEGQTERVTEVPPSSWPFRSRGNWGSLLAGHPGSLWGDVAPALENDLYSLRSVISGELAVHVRSGILSLFFNTEALVWRVNEWRARGDNKQADRPDPIKTSCDYPHPPTRTQDLEFPRLQCSGIEG